MLDATVNKVGMLPVFTDSEGTRHYLIYWPKAKNPEEQNLIRHWQLARGTVEGEESPEKTALREAEEELGIMHDMLKGEVRSLGVHQYQSPKKGPYPVHWYELPMKKKAEKLQAEDATAVRWATAQEIDQLVKEDKFKPSYHQLFKTLISQQYTSRGDAVGQEVSATNNAVRR